MKIAIMTWYSFNNYGSKLQATAMMETLKKMGFEPYFIKYNPRGIIQFNQNNELKLLFRKLKSKIFNKMVINEKFDEFSKKNFMETDLCDSYVDLYQLNDKFDAFICGSDQIWSPNNFDSKFFLDFACQNKIIAYAPSIGFSNIESSIIQEKMKTLISRFNHLSIREETGAKIIRELCNKEAQVVVDPTLLLNNKEWAKYENSGLNSSLNNQKYVLTYFLGKSNKYIRKIQKYAKDNDLKIYNIPVYQRKKINKYNYNEKIGPSEFLSLIKHASCVFTDSFHGMLFSINYNIDFYVYKRFNANSKINQNSRVLDFLKRLSLEERLVEKNSEIFLNNINYENVNKKLKELRKKSSYYLTSALNDVLSKKSFNIEKSGKYLTSYCSGCGTCSAVCPTHAISIEINKEGFQSYVFNEEKCIKCGLCVNACPMLKIDISKVLDCKKFYSFKALDKNILSKSSSGGVAHIIASTLNKKGYYVCGCSYNNEKDIAEHIIIEPNHVDELSKLQGSKYIQSHSAEAIENCIKIGKKNKVLFIGTPCQIAGIDKVAKINKIRDNFILVDIICHGVPTNNLWQKYIKEKMEKYPSLKPKHKIIMRSGTLTKNRKYVMMLLDYNNKVIYKNNQEKDLFYAFFNDGTCYNSSCFECPYRTKTSADIRIGDYWGDRFKNDSTGISMICVMNENGLNLINSIKNENVADIKEQKKEEYFDVQYPMNRNTPLYRDKLLDELKDDSKSLISIKKKYLKNKKIIKKMYRLKKILKK